MKRIISLLLVMISLLTLCSCGSKDRELYNVNLNKYVELADYKGLKGDTKSDEFKQNYEQRIASDIENNQLYKQKTDGKVEKGDVANINYVGKKDGVAFQGGTADNYDLEIGSKSFIDGFEDGLIGVSIGSTVDLNLTFPQNYGNEELNGAKVVFTVKVNYVKAQKTPEEYYKELGFDSVEKYYEDVKKTACEYTLFDIVAKNSKVKDYPQKDYDFLFENSLKTYENIAKNQYGMELEQVLASSGQTLDSFKQQLAENEVKPSMDSQMKIYAIFDKEKLSLDKSEIDNRIKDTVNEINNSPSNSGNKVTEKEVLDYYGRYYFENVVVTEKVLEFLFKNAKIS